MSKETYISEQDQAWLKINPMTRAVIGGIEQRQSSPRVSGSQFYNDVVEALHITDSNKGIGIAVAGIKGLIGEVIATARVAELERAAIDLACIGAGDEGRNSNKLMGIAIEVGGLVASNEIDSAIISLDLLSYWALPEIIRSSEEVQLTEA